MAGKRACKLILSNFYFEFDLCSPSPLGTAFVLQIDMITVYEVILHITYVWFVTIMYIVVAEGQRRRGRPSATSVHDASSGGGGCAPNANTWSEAGAQLVCFMFLCFVGTNAWLFFFCLCCKCETFFLRNAMTTPCILFASRQQFHGAACWALDI